MSQLYVERTHVTREYGGRKCDSCKKEHLFDPAPGGDRDGVYELTPAAAGWMCMCSAGSNASWDFCADCWGRLTSVIGNGTAYR